VSVSGFFQATESEMRAIIKKVDDLVQRGFEDENPIRIGDVICTDTGYVLLDVRAPAISRLAKTLGEMCSRELGVHIRPKAVNHISLACNRSELHTRDAIKQLYSRCNELEKAKTGVKFDLVLSKLLRSSTFERFEQDGGHQFAQMARIPVNYSRGSTVMASCDV